MPKNKGKIHIYTGDGKGKTTASLGLAIRAVGSGLKVGIIYFDKGGDYYNERKILDQLKGQGLEYIAFGKPRMTGKQGFRFKNESADLQEASRALDQAQVWMQSDFDILILDEINTTVKTGLLELKDFIHLIKQKPDHLELILTGRYCTPEIMELGDLITEMKMIKHYLSTGLPARPGIEF
ncbi:cob(I)yrinic acid a,c-diamide adenosyltransferase [Candidatus Parcubacteria bacterium]|jgi:cob(I)alamin adenosyltransferase|nr:cob(I)yrinic acid a,c-diamide adenosyltransferase [Candidatus Parcubacteria bacterium]